MSTEQGVKLYALSTCSHCKAAKQLLGDCRVEYDSVDVDLLKGDERQEAIEELKGINPACSFPTIIIGDTIIVGFREEQIRETLGL